MIGKLFQFPQTGLAPAGPQIDQHWPRTTIREDNALPIPRPALEGGQRQPLRQQHAGPPALGRKLRWGCFQPPGPRWWTPTPGHARSLDQLEKTVRLDGGDQVHFPLEKLSDVGVQRSLREKYSTVTLFSWPIR